MLRATLSQEQFVCQGAELLPGGRASGMSPTDFDPVQLRRGTRVELEHTPDWRLAREIAMDHLAEDPDYYKKLATIHVDGAELGDAREDTISLLATILGRERATKAVDDLETVVVEEAEAQVRPIVTAAIVVGVLGVLAGGTALVLTLRRR